MEYRLYHEEQLLGVLRQTDTDMPWFLGTFEPTPEFEEFRPLFDQELELLNAERMDEWEFVWDSISDLDLRLESQDGSIDDFLLHIEGTKASWRY